MLPILFVLLNIVPNCPISVGYHFELCVAIILFVFCFFADIDLFLTE